MRVYLCKAGWAPLTEVCLKAAFKVSVRTGTISELQSHSCQWASLATDINPLPHWSLSQHRKSALPEGMCVGAGKGGKTHRFREKGYQEGSKMEDCNNLFHIFTSEVMLTTLASSVFSQAIITPGPQSRETAQGINSSSQGPWRAISEEVCQI